MIIRPIKNTVDVYMHINIRTFYEVTSKLVTLLKFTEAHIQVSSVLVLTVCCPFFNLLKPTGHVMHHQFNIQQLYALSTVYLCVLYLSENKQRLVPLTA